MYEKKLKAMREGGGRLSEIKALLGEKIAAGTGAVEIDDLAQRLINRAGGTPSFKGVTNYSWATCINVNEGVVHGIPKKELVFEDGDVVSVDVGMKYKGYHTDTSFSVAIGDSPKKQEFLNHGREALAKAIGKAVVGAKIGDISWAIEKTLKKHSLNPITSLTGHGIGKALHEPPLIPCFVSGSFDEAVEIRPGMTLAIEVMYTSGDGRLKLSSDGWTLSTKDAKLAGLFEETVAIADGGPIVLTQPGWIVGAHYDKENRKQSS